MDNFFNKMKSNPVLYFIIIYLIISNLQKYFTSPESLLILILEIPAILIAITFHEYAHAKAADILGDDTPRMQGRLSLNPMKHIDPIGIVLLLTAGFGWGKPVEINPSNFNRKISTRKGKAIVAFAGPAMNFLIAIVVTLIYSLCLRFVGTGFYSSVIGEMLLSIIELDIGLGVFNLLPLPPLDGQKIFLSIISPKLADWFETYDRIFYIIFVFIWVSPIASMIVSPIIQYIFSLLVKLIMLIA